MQSLFINRQSSARPITSPKQGRSRWSRRRRTTLTGPDIIAEPGALILTARCESVRILAAASAASPGRLAPTRAESRAATERSRAGSRGVAATWRPAQADGRRAKERARVSAPRVASSRYSTRTHRSSAARRAFVTVGNARRAAARRFSPSACCPADATRRRVMGASLTPVQTLPFWGKENSVPLKENENSFS